MVESITYKYINGNLAQEYAANWKVESQNLPSGILIELILGNKINGYVKRVMLRIKIN